MLYELYVITNKINNKKYVGQVNQPYGYLNRFKDHYKESIYCYAKKRYLCLFHAAIIKYGIENFKTELILNNIPESEIDDLEKFYIKKYHTFFRDKDCWGYNMTEGGQGVHGYKHTSKTIEILSKKSKEWWKNLKNLDPEEYNRLCKLRSDNLKGILKSPEVKKKFSEAARKNCSRKDYINPFKNKHHSEETKNIISQKNGYKVGMFDIKTNELIKEFQSCEIATKYLIDEGITKNKNAKSRILYVCDIESRSAYWFKWRRLS